MKNTPFHQFHLAAGAKMAPFAGYNMPISYTGIKNEHLCVRERVGLFDVSHMGEFIVKGKNALQLVQRLSSNNAAKLSPGKAQYSCLLKPNGGIVDDMLVYCLNANEYMLVVNASNIQKDWDWIKSNAPNEGIELEDISERYALLAVQGPDAAKALQSLTDIDLANMPYFNFEQGTLAGVKDVIVSATGYTGSGGFELYFHNRRAEQLWNAITQSGEKYGILPIGLGARNTLRLEKGYALYGNDIDESTTPLEAGLGWITKFDTDFDAKAALLEQKEKGLQRRLVGFELTQRGIARNGYIITNSEGIEIGKVTSGTQSPILGKAVGLGYVKSKHKKPGTEIFIQIRNKSIPAKVVKLPFV